MSTKRKGKPPQPAAKKDEAINIDTIIDRDIASKIPANQKVMYDKVVLAGMRIMFDRQSHSMALAELDKPGPMPQKLASGIIGLMYLLWTESNQTIPPQLIVPVTLTFTLRAFQFLQLSQDPEATKETLGEATALAVEGIMSKFGATPDRIPALVKGQGGAQPGAQQPQAAPQASGMLAGEQ